MRVRFASWLAASLAGTGLVVLAVAVVLVVNDSSEGGIPVLAAGIVLTLIGGLYLGPLPYVIVNESSVAIPVVAGPQGRIRIGPGDRVRMDGDRIVVVGPGNSRRVPAYRAFARREDWNRLVAALGEQGDRSR